MRLDLIVILLSVIVLLSESDGAKILGFFPGPSKSHVILGKALLKGLALKGHDVTMVSPFPQEKPVKNYRDIVMMDARVVLADKMFNKTNMFDMRNQNPIVGSFMVYGMGSLLTDVMLADEVVQKFLKSKEKFDLIIIEVFVNDAFLTLGHHFNAPVVAFSTIGASAWINDFVGNPSPYSHVSDVFAGYSDHMNFQERFVNTFLGVISQLVRRFFFLPKQEAIKEKYFPNAPDLSTISKNTSLVLVNSHFSLSSPRAKVPAVIEIGGFHVGTPKPLPDNLQKLLDEAKEGVIYFSMGSNLKSADLHPEKRDALLQVFSKLKQTVFWKWEDEVLPNQPKNVKISKWYPQQDILAHPNVKIFITHGGLLSTTEAVTFGVPVIGIPIFGDQDLNMKSAQTHGYGVKIHYDNITVESMSWAINEILTNPKYSANMKLRSRLLKDQPIAPLDKAIYWCEYVIRYNGARHLRSAALDINLAQYLLLDIIGTVIISVLILSFSLMYCCKKLFCKTSKTNLKKKTQ